MNWTRVQKKLPKDNLKVLLYVKIDNEDVYNVGILKNIYNQTGWEVEGESYDHWTPVTELYSYTHWMPLPEKPKE